MTAMKLKTRLEERDGQTVFVINRKEWLRGDGGVDSVLWDTRRRMGCCLGLAAIVEGVPAKDIAGYAGPTPASVLGCAEFPAGYAAVWIGMPNAHRDAAIQANDEEELSEPEREAEVAEVFKRARGWLVEFED